jgi:hypothetical protein
VGIACGSCVMGRISPNAPISGSSRRRLARWLVGSPVSVVERDLVLETLAHTHGNRTLSAQLLGMSVRTLRNKIIEYSGHGIDVPPHESRGQLMRHKVGVSVTKRTKTADMSDQCSPSSSILDKASTFLRMRAAVSDATQTRRVCDEAEQNC